MAAVNLEKVTMSCEAEAENEALRDKIAELQAKINELEVCLSKKEEELDEKSRQLGEAVRAAMEHKERFAQMKVKFNTVFLENGNLEEKLQNQAETIEAARRRSEQELANLQARLDDLAVENDRLRNRSLVQQLEQRRLENEETLRNHVDADGLHSLIREQNTLIDRLISVFHGTPVPYSDEVATLNARIRELELEQRKMQVKEREHSLVIAGYEKSHKLAMDRINDLELLLMRVNAEMREKTENPEFAERLETLTRENSVLHNRLISNTELIGKLQRKVVKWKEIANGHRDLSADIDQHLRNERIKLTRKLAELKQQCSEKIQESSQSSELTRLRAANAEMKTELGIVKSEVAGLKLTCQELVEKCKSYEDVVEGSMSRVMELQKEGTNLLQAFEQLVQGPQETNDDE